MGHLARSPRRALVIDRMEELLRIAENLGARRVALCGSVARGSDRAARYGQVRVTNDSLLAVADAYFNLLRARRRLAALGGRTWNVPALAGGLALVRNGVEMACYDLKAP